MMNKKVKISTVKDSKKHLHLVHSNPAELTKSKKFKVYSSSPFQKTQIEIVKIKASLSHNIYDLIH